MSHNHYFANRKPARRLQRRLGCKSTSSRRAKSLQPSSGGLHVQAERLRVGKLEVTICDFKWDGGRRKVTYAFTEHGVAREELGSAGQCRALAFVGVSAGRG